MSLRVLETGLLTSVQDLGRPGFAHLGLGESGAMDRGAHCAANRMVGNADSEATLECALRGPQLEFASERLIALCGAEFELSLEGRPLACGQAYVVPAGARLHIGACTEGVYGYLAVSGGLASRIWMGSRSVHLAAGIGAPLASGEIIELAAPERSAPPLRSRSGLVRRMAPDPEFADDEICLRFVPSAAWQQMSVSQQQAFTLARWRVAANSGRMAMRFEGAPIQDQARATQATTAVVRGTLQLPPDGLPLALMAEHQTTGGYARLGEVITADLDRLAQRRPGQSVRWCAIDRETAQSAYLHQRATRARWQLALSSGYP